MTAPVAEQQHQRDRRDGDDQQRPIVPPEQVEAAAEALLAQLAVDTRKDSLVLPPFLATKARIAVAACVATVVLIGVGLAGLTILGALLP